MICSIESILLQEQVYGRYISENSVFLCGQKNNVKKLLAQTLELDEETQRLLLFYVTVLAQQDADSARQGSRLNLVQIWAD